MTEWWFNGFFHGIYMDLLWFDGYKLNGMYPPVICYIAIESGHRIHRNCGFSHWKWWCSIVMFDYQRVNLVNISYLKYHIHPCYGYPINLRNLTIAIQPWTWKFFDNSLMIWWMVNGCDLSNMYMLYGCWWITCKLT